MVVFFFFFFVVNSSLKFRLMVQVFVVAASSCSFVLCALITVSYVRRGRNIFEDVVVVVDDLLFYLISILGLFARSRSSSVLPSFFF